MATRSPIDAGAPATAAEPVVDAAPVPATVTLDIRPWCDVRIDGRDLGRAARDRIIALAPGAHDIQCTQGSGRPHWRTRVTLGPGEHRALSGSVLRPVRVRLALARGRHAVVGKRRHDNGASFELSPGRYRVAIFDGARELASSWIAIPAIAACTLRDQPALDCYR